MDVAGCALPDDCLVDLEHEVWWRWEPDGASARLGLLASCAAFAGAIEQVAFRPPSPTVAEGRSVATVVSARFTGAVRMPLEVEILERNAALPGRPRLLNDRPYDEGWVVRVRPVRPAEVAARLEGADAVRERLAAEIVRRRIRCWPKFPDTELVETGAECAAILARLREEMGRRQVGETVLLVTDDPTSPIEMVRWSDQTGFPVLAQRRDGPIHWFLVERVANPVPRRRRS